MKIKKMYVENLNEQITTTVNFNETINILTGANGSGKTTFLKACWYLYSGNLTNLFLEINFSKIILETDILTVTVICDDYKSEDPIFSIKIIKNTNFVTIFPETVSETLTGTIDEIREKMWRYSIVISLEHNSLYFPTFRRVEGGYTQSSRKLRSKRNNNSVANTNSEADTDELTKALKATSYALTEFENKFICSMSTEDVEKLVSDTKSKMDTKQKEAYEILAENISSSIKTWKLQGELEPDSAAYLRDIFEQVTSVEKNRDQIVKPMELLNKQVEEYFPNRTIKLKNKNLGKGSNEISADLLSAGEKQLLSFLCYSAFYTNLIFMVDEPELSLHLDWQRKLISSLTELGSSNQFFFVTHSPAIYTKFSDFEISFDDLLATSID